MSGIGLAPLGTCIFGYGSPADAAPIEGLVLPNNQEQPQDSRVINPATGDYVINANGSLAGQPSISQQVYLAVVTTLGTSAVSTLGSDSSAIQTVDTRSPAKTQNMIEVALASLIGSQTITLLSVNTTANSNALGLNVTLTWLDNTTNQVNNLTL